MGRLIQTALWVDSTQSILRTCSIFRRFNYRSTYVCDFISLSHFFSAPEAPPSNIRVVNTLGSISSLNLEWNRILEDKANGIILGYFVEYTAIILNGQQIELEKQVTKTFRVRGNRYATIVKYLIPGSTYHIKMFGYTIKNGTKSSIVIGSN